MDFLFNFGLDFGLLFDGLIGFGLLFLNFGFEFLFDLWCRSISNLLLKLLFLFLGSLDLLVGFFLYLFGLLLFLDFGGLGFLDIVFFYCFILFGFDLLFLLLNLLHFMLDRLGFFFGHFDLFLGFDFFCWGISIFDLVFSFLDGRLSLLNLLLNFVLLLLNNFHFILSFLNFSLDLFLGFLDDILRCLGTGCTILTSLNLRLMELSFTEFDQVFGSLDFCIVFGFEHTRVIRTWTVSCFGIFHGRDGDSLGCGKESSDRNRFHDGIKFNDLFPICQVSV